MDENIAAVITAAGSSSRMNGIKKEYRLLPGSDLTVLGCAANAFIASKRIGIIVFAIPVDGEQDARASLPADFFNTEKKILFVQGGATRQKSVYNALSLLETYKPAIVLIHDGARPWIKTALIEKVIDEVSNNKYGAALPVLPLTETPKEIKYTGQGNGIVTRHLKRRELGMAQTPQGFIFPEILKAHEKAKEKEHEYTDDAEIWGEFIGPVAVVSGDPENRKITFPGDLEQGSTNGINE